MPRANGLDYCLECWAARGFFPEDAEGSPLYSTLQYYCFDCTTRLNETVDTVDVRDDDVSDDLAGAIEDYELWEEEEGL